MATLLDLRWLAGVTLLALLWGGAVAVAGGAATEPGAEWCARGRLVAVERRGEEPSVELIDLGARRRVVVPGFNPRISPDGEHVVVGRAVAAGVALVVINVPTGRELRLPGTLASREPPRWSPDGKRLLATLRLPDERPGPDGPGSPPARETSARREAEVFLLDLSEREPELSQLTEGGGGGARWLGRGERLIYEVPDGRGGFSLLLRDRGGFGAPRPFWEDDPIPQAADFAAIS